MTVSNDNLVKEIARTQDRYITLLQDTEAILDRWWEKSTGADDEMALKILTELELIVEVSRND